MRRESSERSLPADGHTHTQQRTTPEWVAQGCHNQDTPVQHLRR